MPIVQLKIKLIYLQGYKGKNKICRYVKFKRVYNWQLESSYGCCQKQKTVLGNNKSTQSDVDNSLSSINTAINGLIKGGSEEPKSYTGDIDLDGEVTASDSALLFQYVLNKSYIPIESVDLKYADIDHNNVIDSIDVAHILQKSLDSSYNIENIQIQ